MAQRIKGQEVEIVMMVDGAPRENLTMCRSIELTWKTETTQEGYLGETTDRYDTIFKGISGKLEFHFDSPEPFVLIEKIVEKARRREPGTRFNIKATFNFPSGKRARILIPEVEFGEMPVSFGSRADYGSFSLPIAASEAKAMPLS